MAQESEREWSEEEAEEEGEEEERGANWRTERVYAHRDFGHGACEPV